ncbi:MAG: methyltransferase domain-containing protein [Myxococcota bacterium]
MNSKNTPSSGENYLMESPQEAMRLEAKTDEAVTRNHLNLVRLPVGCRALDAGAGTGAVARIMADMVGTKGHVTAIDASPERVEFGLQLASKHGVKNFSMEVMDLYGLTFPNDTFDFIWSRFVFEYLAQPERALKELYRVVRPKGRIVVADLDSNGLIHEPLSASMRDGLQTIERALAGRIDLNVGRKLYGMFLNLVLKNIHVHLLPYNLYAGKASTGALANWREKFERIAPLVASKFASAADYGRFVDEYLDFIADPETFSYSVLLMVEGHK